MTVGEIREELIRRAGWRCHYCAAPVSISDGPLKAEIHHAHHVSKKISLTNGTVCCKFCHRNIVHKNRTLRFGGGKK